MSIYDQRDRPAYEPFRADLRDATNPRILRWWTPDHDALLQSLIVRLQWVWYWNATDGVVAMTAPAILDAWRGGDPRCRSHAWYNVLMNFAAARAEQLGLTARIRKPRRRYCLLCGQGFVEDSLPEPLVRRLGVDRLEFCAPCLGETVLQGTGNPSASADAVLGYLPRLAAVVGRVPPQGFGEDPEDLQDLDTRERLEVLQALRNKPTVKRVKQLFSSWLNALIQAEVLEDGARRTSRGIQTIARDGHACLSLGERTICEFLHGSGIAHEKEPPYPDGHFRGDFRVGAVIVEYFGLVGDPEYDARTKAKLAIARRHRLTVVPVYPKDLASRSALANKLSGLR